MASSFLEAIESVTEKFQVASEKSRLQAAVERIKNKMLAFQQTLELILAQKKALESAMADAPEALQSLYQAQLVALTNQEAAILEKAGAVPAKKPMYVRNGKRFELAANGK